METAQKITPCLRFDGQAFTALNGGPVFKFNEAISFRVRCATQDEVDHCWSRLAAGGDEQARQCGWLKKRYGVSWQVVPVVRLELVTAPHLQEFQRVTQAMLQMKKLDIERLQQACAQL